VKFSWSPKPLPTVFITVDGERISINGDPDSYTYAIPDANNSVRIKFPDVPEFVISAHEQDLVRQHKKQLERRDFIIGVLKGKFCAKHHPMFSNLFQTGDVWQILKESWYDEQKPGNEQDFNGLKEGDQIKIVSHEKDPKSTYYGWIANEHPHLKSRNNKQEQLLAMFDANDFIQRRIMFIGNPDVPYRSFGDEHTGDITIPVGKVFKLTTTLASRFYPEWVYGDERRFPDPMSRARVPISRQRQSQSE
jgi:hypothetical protein